MLRGRLKFRVWYVPVAIVLLVVVVYVTAVLVGKGRLERRIEGLQARGLPTSYEELEALYKLPEGVENAADTYERAFGLVIRAPAAVSNGMPITGTGVLADDRGPLDPNVISGLKSHLQTNARALQLLHEAAAIKECRYRREFTGTFPMLPVLSEIRRSVQLLAEQVIYYACQGQDDLVCRSLADQFALSRSLSENLTLIDQLVRIACISLSISSVEQAVNRASLTDEQLLWLQGELERIASEDRMKKALTGERCVVIENMNNPQADPAVRIFRYTGMLGANIDVLLQTIDDYDAILELPAHERPRKLEEVQKEVEDMSMLYALASMAGLSFPRIIEIDLRVGASVDCARVAVAVERYRESTGKLPDTLDELVGDYIEEIPLDPFDGKPLRYKRTERGFVVYHIGEDGIDNGGKSRDYDDRDAPYDYPFEVRR
jgi:hypothetical protein